MQFYISEIKLMKLSNRAIAKLKQVTPDIDNQAFDSRAAVFDN